MQKLTREQLIARAENAPLVLKPSERNLTEMDLAELDLRNSQLAKANLRRTNLTAADLRGASLKGANLRQATLCQASLSDADLSGGDLQNANLREADLGAANLSGAILTHADLSRVRLVSADLHLADFHNANLREADLGLANLDEANLTSADLQDADLSGADLHGANLRGANLHRADLRGVRYNKRTRWPEGFNPNQAGMVFTKQEQVYASLTTIWTGSPYPLGATWDGQGVNFALYAEHASRVELCLFDTPNARRESARIVMPEQTDRVWHVYLPFVRPGQIYAYRVYGAYLPNQGLRFNPNKLLIDPYAKALTGKLVWNDALFGYRIDDPAGDISFDGRDSAPYMPRCVVIDNSFPWEDDRRPRTPLNESVIYELHVKGFTALHPEVPEPLRGTYAGLASPAVIDYLRSLGVTAIELMPVHSFVDDRFLVDRGLRNYWGYSTLNFFAPEGRYSYASTPGDQVREFKSMVRAMHAAGIEVIIDVVYNHTAEGNHLGPTLSFRGIDNPTYYRLVNGHPRYYMDYTGTGNTVNVPHPRTLQLIMDSLRYWVQEMRVDGFRFDLAAALSRDAHGTEMLSAFLDVIHQDPVLSQVKLIAEPWDIGMGGYQVGGFPVLWSEWNGKYRDTVRRFWKGDESQVGELAYRLAGSSDLYQHNGRQPYASINFVTAHDGFTLRDLVTYNRKHNEANGDNNHDGDDHNNSWNGGVEGPTDDPKINALRATQMRNLMATLLLSQGVPMILAGDERGRTQQGNNNAYCQDNELSWIDWSLDETSREMLAFTRRLIQLRKQHPVLRRRRFFQGRRIHGSDIRDIVWLRPDGYEMDDEEWHNGLVRCIGMLLNGQAMREWDRQQQSVYDDVLLLVLNAYYKKIPFHIPEGAGGNPWEVLVDTAADNVAALPALQPTEHYQLEGRSLILLRQRIGGWDTEHSHHIL